MPDCRNTCKLKCAQQQCNNYVLKKMLLYLSVLMFVSSCYAVNVTVMAGDRPFRTVPRSYLSVGLDSAMIRDHWCNIIWKKAVVLGRELSPAYLRFGGNDADRMQFDPFSVGPNSANCHIPWSKPKTTTFSMNKTQFRTLIWLAKRAGWHLIFDFNALLRDSKNQWDPTNAKEILDYASRNHYYGLGFELGNEPNDWRGKYNRSVSPTELGNDYNRLQKVLSKFPKYRNSFVIGPSISQPKNKRRIRFLRKFLKTASHSVNAVTFHQYYVNGRTATVDQFLNSTILDFLKKEIITAVKLTKRYASSSHQVWLGETASAFGGGAPYLSDSYIAGFMWLDKLGMGASLGLDIVIRQSFYRCHYSLLDGNSDPNPDYWLSIIFKKIVGTGVLNVTVTADKEYSKMIRFYAHCSGTKVTYFGMNLGEQELDIYFPNHNGSVVQYLIEPLDHDILSKKVMLNRKELVFDGHHVPHLAGEAIQKRPITLPARRFAFYVMHHTGSC